MPDISPPLEKGTVQRVGVFLGSKIVQNPVVWGLVVVLLLVLALGGTSTALLKWRAERALKRQLFDQVSAQQKEKEETAAAYVKEMAEWKTRALKIEGERIRLRNEVGVLRRERANWKPPVTLQEATDRFNALEVGR